MCIALSTVVKFFQPGMRTRRREMKEKRKKILRMRIKALDIFFFLSLACLFQKWGPVIPHHATTLSYTMLRTKLNEKLRRRSSQAGRQTSYRLLYYSESIWGLKGWGSEWSFQLFSPLLLPLNKYKRFLVIEFWNVPWCETMGNIVECGWIEGKNFIKTFSYFKKRFARFFQGFQRSILHTNITAKRWREREEEEKPIEGNKAAAASFRGMRVDFFRLFPFFKSNIIVCRDIKILYLYFLFLFPSFAIIKVGRRREVDRNVSGISPS